MKIRLKEHTLVFILTSLISLFSCKSDFDYAIEDKYQTKPTDCLCDISYHYPQINSNNSTDSNLIDLNKALKLMGEFDRFIDRCNPESPRFNKTFKKYHCDYKIKLQTDTLLSIEIFNTAYYDNDFKYTRFNSFLLNTKDWTGIPLENLFNGLDRGKIYPFIADYSKNTGNHINLLAYESQSNYALTYGMTRDTLIIYVGGEGEWFGNDKVMIPIKELMK